MTVLFVGSFLFAQGQDEKSIEIGASLFGVRQFKELPSHQYKNGNFIAFPKGILVHSVGKRLRTTLELNYYDLKAELDGTNCWDCGGGSGHLKGIETKVGVFKNYNFGRFSFSPGLSAYFLRTRVTGTYYGGISWSKWEIDTRTNHIGINPTLSFGFGGLKPILISLETGAFFGRLFGKDIDKRFGNERFFSPIQSINLKYKIR